MSSLRLFAAYSVGAAKVLVSHGLSTTPEESLGALLLGLEAGGLGLVLLC